MASSGKRGGFTLVELLVAIGVLTIMLATISGISLEVTRAYKNTTGTIEGFRDARAAFESMTRTISHATLNTYFDYVDATGKFRDPGNPAGFVPTTYGRRSDLQFISGTSTKTLLSTVSAQVPYPITHAIFFLAPMGDTQQSSYTGLNGTLNASGFYVAYGPDPSVPGFLSGTTVPKSNRFRLMQFMEPTENVSIYDTQGAAGQWYLGPISSSPASCVSQMAENIVALIIEPKLSPSDQAANPAVTLAPKYDYDSTDSTNTNTFNQLPPEVDVTMVAIDEASALKLGIGATPPNLIPGSGFTVAASEQSDLANLESNLSASAGNAASNHIPLHFRVFHAEIALSSAKWSK